MLKHKIDLIAVTVTPGSSIHEKKKLKNRSFINNGCKFVTMF